MIKKWFNYFQGGGYGILGAIVVGADGQQVIKIPSGASEGGMSVTYSNSEWECELSLNVGIDIMYVCLYVFVAFDRDLEPWDLGSPEGAGGTGA